MATGYIRGISRLRHALAAGVLTVAVFSALAIDVTFNDSALEAAVRSALGVAAENPVTDTDMTGLSWLYTSNISDLTGLEYAVNLEELELTGGSLSDISILGSLTGMVNLTLSNNSISDISPISTMSNLEWLDLADNSVSDLSALSGLASLEYIYLESNAVSDISALAAKTAMRELWLGENAVSDISVLSGATALQKLELLANEVADITPLISLDTLNYLDLRNNPLAIATRVADLAAIEAANPGIDLSYTPAVENPPPGDANLDGSVNLVDLNIVRDNFFTESGASVYDGDFDGDGDVDIEDFATLKNNYGTVPPGTEPTTPEPASLVILLIGLPLIARRRR